MALCSALSRMAPKAARGFRSMGSKAKVGLMERLANGPVIGDGGYLFCLEHRGYMQAGPWTPECVVTDGDAVKQLHREFQRAGADVLQTLTFYGTEDKMERQGQVRGRRPRRHAAPPPLTSTPCSSPRPGGPRRGLEHARLRVRARGRR